MVQGFDLEELATWDRLAKTQAKVNISAPEGLKKLDIVLSEVISVKFRAQAAKIALQALKDIRRVQKELFHTLVTQVVGHSGPPDLGEFTPRGWRALNPKYADYRRRSRDIPSDVFYEFNSGNLSDHGHYGKTLLELLMSAQPETVFGKPQADSGEVNMKTKGIKPIISITPFPKLGSVILNTREFDLAQMKKLFQARNEPIAYKLSNWSGKFYRPVLEYYLLWWVNVRLKKVLTESVAKYKNKKGSP